jgi:hypothetical protein
MVNWNHYFAGFLISGSMLTSSFGQEANNNKKEPAPQNKPVPPSSPDDIKTAKTLFLVVRVGQLADGTTLTGKELERIFTNSLKETGFKHEKIGVRSLSPSVFNDLNRIMNDGSSNVWRTELDKGVVITQGMVDDRNLLLIRLPKPTMQVKSVDISTEPASVGGLFTNESKDEKRRVVRIASDAYAIPWELNTVINNMKINLLDEGKPLPEIKKDLKGLANTQYYAVSIKNFDGNLNELYKYVQDESKQGNPIKIAEGIQEYTVQLAAMGQESDDNPGRINDRNIWESRLPRLSKGKPSRVWTLFPLTKEQAEAELKKYEEKDPEEIVKEIEKSGKLMTADKMAAVGPATEPQWLEMTPDNLGDFKRDIQLEGLDQLIEKYKDGFHRLKVYELEVKDANRKEAIRVKGKMIENEKVASLPGLIGQKVKAGVQTGEKK